MATNAGKIWKFFKDKGLSEYGIAGLMGNLYYESALNSENLQNTYERSLGYSDSSYTKAVDSGSYKNFVHDSAGYGLAQWTYWSRKKKLLAYARDKGASIGNLTMQCEFLYKELKDDYSSVFKVLQNAKSVKEASNKVLHSFEKPANQSASIETARATKGQEYYNKYRGTQGDDYESIPSGPVKILLVGDSYTYVNGVGQILSELCGKKSIEAVVVRATKGGRSSSELLKESLSYKCWVNGKSTSNGNGQLKTIIDKDFENLDRKGSWDFVISQNNSTVDGTKTGDEKMFKFMVTDNKAVSESKNFILHCTQFGGSLSKNRYNKHKEVAHAKGCSLIDCRGIFSKYESEFSGHDWLKELTVMDNDKHQSARGAYLYACAIFAKLFGTASFPSSKNSTGIGLYNSKDGNAQSFITDHWKGATSKASSLGNKISEDVAYDLQYLVSKYASTYIGSKLSRGTSSFVMTDATSELSDLVDLNKMYQYVITIDRNTKTKLDIKAIQRELNVSAAMVEAGYLFDKNHKRMGTFPNPKLKSQLTALNDAKMPWGLYMISRARSQTEALEEINLFYYVLNEWTPRLGAWIVPEWTFTTKSINDKMLNAMYEKLKQFGFYAKMGLYATKKQIENISWKKHCEKWFLWWVYHTKVEEYKDEVITPEFFMLNDGKNNPQPVTILQKDSGDPYNPAEPDIN